MLRVLIVEDDAVFRRGLARMFLNEECEVTQASDGEQAIVSISAAIPDLVISDLRLPGTDGLGVLGHLQQIGPQTPFILVTAYYSDELAKEVKRQGAAAVFEKPVELKQLRERCVELLDVRQAVACCG